VLVASTRFVFTAARGGRAMLRGGDMLEALRIHVQPHPAKGLDIHAVQAACELIN